MAPKLVHTLRFRVLLFFFLAGGLINTVLVLGTFLTTRDSLMSQVRRELTLSAQIGSLAIPPVQAAAWASRSTAALDEEKSVALKSDPEYIAIEGILDTIKNKAMGPDSLVYLFKKGSTPGTALYLAYSKSPEYASNVNNPFQEEDAVDFPTMIKAFETGEPQTEENLTWDEAEKVYSLSAFAPLPSVDSEKIFLGIDFVDRGLNTRIFNASALIFLSSFLMIFVLIAGGLFLSRKLKKSFGTINTLVEDLAQGEGNLNQRIEIFSKDEFGFLAKHLNHFIGTIHQIVLNVQTIGTTQEKLSCEMEKILLDHNESSTSAMTDMNMMASRYEILSGSVSTTVNSVREIGISLQTLEERLKAEGISLSASAKAMENQVSSLENISLIALEKEKVSKDLKQVTEKGSFTVREAFKHLEAAAGDLGQIQQAINLIQDISENTNLLAMNAAIEAAHAGEKGKGFAVIAGEIRGLSSRTKSNAQSITQNLENLITNLGNAQRTGKESTTALQTISQEIDILIQSFLSILELLTSTSQGNETIKQSMGELQSLSGQVHSASEIINEKAHESQNGMELIAAVNMEINRQVGLVREKISSLSLAADHLRSLGEHNAETLSSLLGEISRFKT